MGVESRKPIHYLKTNPKCWIGASLPTFKICAQEVISQTPLTIKELKGMPWSERHEYLNSYALKRQEKRWEDAVGIKPQDSHFTLLLPIDNQENSLPSLLSSLLHPDSPGWVDVTIAFLPTACKH